MRDERSSEGWSDFHRKYNSAEHPTAVQCLNGSNKVAVLKNFRNMLSREDSASSIYSAGDHKGNLARGSLVKNLRNKLTREDSSSSIGSGSKSTILRNIRNKLVTEDSCSSFNSTGDRKLSLMGKRSRHSRDDSSSSINLIGDCMKNLVLGADLKDTRRVSSRLSNTVNESNSRRSGLARGHSLRDIRKSTSRNLVANTGRIERGSLQRRELMKRTSSSPNLMKTNP